VPICLPFGGIVTDKGFGGWKIEVLVVDSLMARASNSVLRRKRFGIDGCLTQRREGFAMLYGDSKTGFPAQLVDDAETQGDGFKRRIEERE
jgi:hypothetical protein